MGARDQLRAHFLANLGRVMATEELQRVSGGISEWARRVRELRNEEGFQILTHNDRDDLKPGEYVLDRNGFTCQMCGAVAGEPHPFDPERKTRLHIGHIIDKSLGGSDEPTNLRAMCSVCNEGATNSTLPRPDLQKLLVQVRRATVTDQRAVLDWLRSKFKS